MRHLTFTEEERKRLLHEKQNHPHPRIRLRMEVLHLKSLGKPHKEISEITGVGGCTIRSYFDQYEEGGIEKLSQLRFYRPQSDLHQYEKKIRQSLEEKPVFSVKECSARIEELCGIKRSTVQVWKFMRNIGLDYRKIAAIPGKAVSEEKKKNKKSLWSPN